MDDREMLELAAKAAGPELLEALQEAVDMLREIRFSTDADQEGAVTEYLRRAEFIITKATGASHD